MSSATARRSALVAAMVLLAPLWWLSGPTRGTHDRADAVLARLAAPATAPGPAIRRQAHPASWLHGARPDSRRVLLVALVVALLGLAGPAPWTAVMAVAAARSPLHRRRHAISLRAPPLLLQA